MTSCATKSVHTAACNWLFNTISVSVIRNLLPPCIVIEIEGKGILGHAMNTYWVAEVLLHSFLTLILVGGEWSASPG